MLWKKLRHKYNLSQISETGSPHFGPLDDKKKSGTCNNWKDTACKQRYRERQSENIIDALY